MNRSNISTCSDQMVINASSRGRAADSYQDEIGPCNLFWAFYFREKGRWEPQIYPSRTIIAILHHTSVTLEFLISYIPKSLTHDGNKTSSRLQYQIITWPKRSKQLSKKNHSINYFLPLNGTNHSLLATQEKHTMHAGISPATHQLTIYHQHDKGGNFHSSCTSSYI